MANFFDQFDEAPAAQPAKGNFFDQFDEKPSVAADIVTRAVPTGLVKAAASVPGMPGDMQSMGNQLVDRIMLGVAHKGMDWSGYGPQSGTPDRERFDALWNAIGSGGGLPTSQDIKSGVEKVTGPLPEAQTVPGKMTEAVIANAPAAAIGGGGALARAANVVVP